jgi:predicted metal-dependent hydrolase
MSESLVIGDLSFALRRSARRKTVGITIDRDGALILTAPIDCPLELIERTARDKQFWIYTKLAEKELLFKPGKTKEFVNGEGFYYLGRSYRLLLVGSSPSDASVPALCLHHGRFMLRRDERHHAREHFINWYIEHGRPWLQRRVDLFVHRIGVEPRTVEVRDLGFRWGSCGRDGSLHFHWRTVLLPPSIIEYIVTHELVHVIEPHHTPAFWARLERIIPDFSTRKQWLAENGATYAL